MEIRTSKDGSLQTMVPPSIHPATGELLEWTGDSPTEVTALVLVRACSRLAAATLLVSVFPEHGRNEMAMALSGALLRNGWAPEEAENFVRAVYTHGGSDGPEKHVRAVAATQAKLEVDEPATGLPHLAEMLGKEVVDKLVLWLGLKREDSAQYVFDERALADHVARNNSDLMHSTNKKCWYLWDGKRWLGQTSNAKEILLRVIRSVDMVREESLKALSRVPKPVQEEYDKSKKFTKTEEVEGKGETEETELDPELILVIKNNRRQLSFMQQAGSYRTIASTSKLCEIRMSCDHVTFDADPLLFNCQNGTLDLRGPDLRPHAREDFITKIAGVDFLDDADCPKWKKTLDKFLPDYDTRVFVQRYLGYAMSGLMTEQVFPIFWGSGNNGKSTIVGTIAKIFGDYAKTASDRAFMDSNSETQSGLVALEGSRFVRCSEPKEGRLNESLIKQVTGDDEFAARGLHENMRTIRPTWKAVMLCNTEPDVGGGDDGIWRRLRLVPFNVNLREDEVIKNFAEELAKEWSGVLNWCLEGFVDWQLSGLPPSKEVADTTEEYRHDSDPIGEFWEASIDEKQGFADVRDLCNDIYRAYLAWNAARGIRNGLTRIQFSTRIKHRGFKKMKSMGRMFWLELRLNKSAREMLAYSPFARNDSAEG